MLWTVWLMMATQSRNLPRSMARETRSKLQNEAAALRAGISSAPNSTGGRIRVRVHSTLPPPGLPNQTSLAARKSTSSSSASSVNVNRNILRTVGNASSARGLNKAFQKLSIDDKKNAKSTPGKRSQSTSAGSRGACKSLEDVARRILLKKSRNVVVMAGAGISTPSGIPDFRSPGSGLYDNLQQYHIPYPEAIFDIGFFRKNPKPFFTLAKELYPSGKYRPNYVHYFVRMLHDRGILLRMYTQNIDGLERLAGIPGEKLVEAHGTFTTCTCTKCGFEHDGEEVKDLIFADKVPKCKRQTCMGVVKPNIVFFGEDLPKRFFYYMKDMPQCDLLIIMGTSLEVYPFAGIMDSVRPFIPRVLINREAVGSFVRPSSSSSAMNGRFTNDLAVTGDLVECVQKFARILGWKKAMEDLIRENEAALDEMIAAAEARKEKREQERKESLPPKTNSLSGNGISGGSLNSGPQRLTNLQRDQDGSNTRRLHTAPDGLNRANSTVRSASSSNAIKEPTLHQRSKSSVSQRSSVTLPTISSRNRKTSNVYRTKTVVSSDSSETSYSESSEDDSSDS
ncbi:NAD-dependent protein deacetylase sirtuin-2-like [Diadema setosum]|uniref:NAD-dependent protein deacetylase sirtuin-2-like n=1 Tax=Diadema setosum TaxID=31175 RepID=UPI003B3B31B0